jgi:hypothetical protein
LEGSHWDRPADEEGGAGGAGELTGLRRELAGANPAKHSLNVLLVLQWLGPERDAAGLCVREMQDLDLGPGERLLHRQQEGGGADIGRVAEAVVSGLHPPDNTLAP